MYKQTLDTSYQFRKNFMYNNISQNNTKQQITINNNTTRHITSQKNAKQHTTTQHITK